MSRIMSFFARRVQVNGDLRYGREIVCEFAKRAYKKESEYVILDIGAGSGTDLCNVRQALEGQGITMYGVESYAPNCERLTAQGIKTIQVDIERETLPFDTGSVDLVIANQIMEHTKEIFWVLSEISRVLKPEGKCIVGIPNLASFHNRIMLLLGMQPPCIDVVGAHVRGFTYAGFKDFAELEGYFKVLDYKASVFYPFSPKLGSFLCKVFPKCGLALFFYIERSNKKGSYIEVLKKRFFETPYYQGENSAEL